MPRLFGASILAISLGSLLLGAASGCRFSGATQYPTPAASGLNTRDLIDPIAQNEAERLAPADQLFAAAEPGAISTAPVGEHRRLAHRIFGLAVAAANVNLRDVARRLLMEVELRTIALPNVATEMCKQYPREIGQVTALTSGHKPYGRRA